MFHRTILVVLLIHSITAHSALSVYDGSANMQALRRYLMMVQQLSTHRNQLIELKQSVRLAQREVDSITGTRGYSDILQDTVFKETRKQLTFESRIALDDLIAGRLPTTSAELTRGLRALIELYSLDKQYTDYTPEERYARVTGAQETRRNTNAYMTLRAEQHLQNTEVNTAKYEELINEIDNTQDIKASTDLANRIAVENGILLNQLINLQANILKNTATTQATQEQIEQMNRIETGLTGPRPSQ